jgi:hypothetical protein
MKSPMSKHVVRFAIACMLFALSTACKSPMHSDNTASAPKLDKWSWLPQTHQNDAAAAQIPQGATISFFIPENEPLDTKSNGWGGISSTGEFVPTDKKSYTVKGGALEATIGPIVKKAHWGDWGFVYADEAHSQKVGWGNSLTSGDLLLPKKVFLDPPADRFVQNSYEVEPFGNDYVVIHLDPAKGHRLCFMKVNGGTFPTAGYLGSKAEVGGNVLTRKADGWYLGNRQVSQ